MVLKILMLRFLLKKLFNRFISLDARSMAGKTFSSHSRGIGGEVFARRISRSSFTCLSGGAFAKKFFEVVL